MKNVFLLFIILLSTTTIYAQWTDGQAADRVLGQPDLISNTADNGGISATTLDGTSGIAIDLINGKMYVSDEDNHRVLRYSYPITSDQQAAEIVFGQTTFLGSNSGITATTLQGPSDLAVDNTGRLWISDGNNDRVIWFNAAHSIMTNAPAADGVLGQPDFVTKNPSTVTINIMNTIEGIALAADGTLWVSDERNDRVLRFDNAASKSNGADADGVLGQADFTSNGANRSGLVDANTMNSPMGLAIAADGTLWLTDRSNHRVLRFDNAASKSNGANADGVLGQSAFIYNTLNNNNGSVTANGIDQPQHVALDAGGRLYVTDRNNNRVLIFNNAANKGNGADADNVLGQANFTSNGTGITASTMAGGFRSSVVIDNTNNLLWCSDGANNRVTRFTASATLLPVELSYFRGQATTEGNLLTWQTASEKNNDGFEIQHSVNAQEWEALDFVKGNGTTLDVQNYAFTDEQALIGKNYYRLKQVDFDEKFEYSNIVEITIGKLSNPTINIYPNPVQDDLTIENGEGLVTVYNVLGQPVHQITNKESQITLNLNDLPQGQYILKIIKANGAIITKQFVK
jgi:hypothetical protein